jgi:hypothetical protein
MTNPRHLSPLTLFAAVSLAAAGELAVGTSALFTALAAATLLCAGATYNLLGGLGTIRGMAFATFAACTIVISQFAKVIFWEPADNMLEAPQLTIEVYFAFFVFVFIGCFITRDLRVQLPKPVEAETTAQANLHYFISLTAGIAANLIYEYYESSSYSEDRSSAAHSLGLALSPLLLYSIVLAVKRQIKVTLGRHSFGPRVFVPWLAMSFFGFVETSRAHLMLSTLAYGVTCHMNGFRFRKVHYAAACLGAFAFIVFVSPFEIGSRGPMREVGLIDRIGEGILLVKLAPQQEEMSEADHASNAAQVREEYFAHPRTGILSRLSAIRADSNMIAACSGGFHYGFTALKMDALRSLPRSIARGKPDTDGAAYTGRVTGINPDEVENGEAMITVIGDSFGAFGWLGVASVGLLVFPAILTLYQNVFDMNAAWGAVASVDLIVQISQVSLGGLIGVAIRVPLTIVLMSYLVNLAAKAIPVRGDRMLLCLDADDDALRRSAKSARAWACGSSASELDQ